VFWKQMVMMLERKWSNVFSRCFYKTANQIAVGFFEILHHSINMKSDTVK
jgi:hypothetical protein